MSDDHPGSGRAGLPQLSRVRTPGGAVSVDVPAAWETIAVGHDHDAVAALEPDDGGRFCTSFVLAVGPDDEPAGEGPAGEGQAGEGAAEHVLLDHEDVRVGGHPGTRRLTTHATPAHESVTTESWSSVVDGLRVTLTANVATVRLNELSRLVDAVAASLVVAAPGSGPA